MAAPEVDVAWVVLPSVARRNHSNIMAESPQTLGQCPVDIAVFADEKDAHVRSFLSDEHLAPSYDVESGSRGWLGETYACERGDVVSGAGGGRVQLSHADGDASRPCELEVVGTPPFARSHVGREQDVDVSAAGDVEFRQCDALPSHR